MRNRKLNHPLGSVCLTVDKNKHTQIIIIYNNNNKESKIKGEEIAR